MYLVPVSTEGIMADHECGNWIEQHSKQDCYWIQLFYSQSVSIKHRLRTADYGLWTGYKHGPGIKCGLENMNWI